LQNDIGRMYTAENLKGVRFLVSPLHQHQAGIKGSGKVFKIKEVVKGEAIVIWDENGKESYAKHWALHYLNTGVWVVCR